MTHSKAERNTVDRAMSVGRMSVGEAPKDALTAPSGRKVASFHKPQSFREEVPMLIAASALFVLAWAISGIWIYLLAPLAAFSGAYARHTWLDRWKRIRWWIVVGL